MYRAKRVEGKPIWNIIEERTNKVIAHVDIFQKNNNEKKLVVQGEVICSVESIKDAKEKLQLFFEGNRTQIISNRLIIEELKRDLTIVRSQHAYKLIANDIERLEKNIRVLESFNSITQK